MKTSANGLELIKKYEGCVLHAYQCPSKVWTIGYGHTRGVKQGDVITQQDAHNFLIEDIESCERAVNKLVERYELNQNEFDALVSFTFNCGSGNLNKLTANNTRSKQEISEKILAYNKSNGKVLNGLVRRRKEEQILFNTPYVVEKEEQEVNAETLFFPKFTGKQTGIDEILSSVGATKYYDNSKRHGFERRKSIALANGFTNYRGTYSENMEIINLAKLGKLRKPQDKYYPIYKGDNNNIDVVCANIGANKDYAISLIRYKRRLPIAVANGIKDYTGTTKQNLLLVSLAKKGLLIKA